MNATCVLLAVFFVFPAAQAAQPSLTPMEAATLVRQPSEVIDLALSPDGRAIVYSVHRRDFREERHITELFLQRLDSSGASVETPSLLEHTESARLHFEFHVKWSPNSDAFAYFPPAKGAEAGSSSGLTRYDLGAARAYPIPVLDKMTDSSTGTGRRRITNIPRGYQWSPSGRYIAFVDVASVVTDRPKAGASVPITTRVLDAIEGFRGGFLNLETTSQTRGLFVLDVQTGVVDLISPESRTIGSAAWEAAFSWAPDDKHLATFVQSPTGSLELIAIDRATREVRRIAADLSFTSREVSWSPDGKWIAFLDASLVDGAWAVVPASGGTPVRLGGPDDPQPRALSTTVTWTQDGSRFYYLGSHRWTHALTQVDLQARRVKILSTHEKVIDSPVSFNADGTRLAFVRSSYTIPDEVFVRRWPDGESRQLTQLSPGFPLTSKVRVERVKWRSRDDKFTIHGYVLLPSDGSVNSKSSGPLPTVVFINGGPSMGANSYAGDSSGSHGEMLALAARGYAVFIPNTRGRSGENEAFRRGILDGNYARLPFEDVMSGVESLIRRGIADPARLGVMGHSYGGFLTGYSLTQTNRFKAAVVYEGGLYSWGVTAFSRVPGTWGAKKLYQIHGAQNNPFEPREMKSLMDQSPVFQMRCIVTPTLLLAGHSANEMRPMVSALTRFGIPVEFIGYQNELHAFAHISAEIDYVTRLGAWFDYWLRDMPYPEQSLQKEYDRWRASKTMAPQDCPANGRK